MNISKRIVLFVFIAISSVLNAMELPSQEPKMVNLVSADNLRFEVPLEIALEIKVYGPLQDYFKSNIGIALPISSRTLAELVQLMQMLYANKDFSLARIIDKAKKEIPIHDNYEFAVAVKYLNFEPGIDLIAEKYKKTENYSVPKNDYEYYMKLIRELNPKAYDKLRRCELTNGKPCLEINFDEEHDGVVQGSHLFHGYPLLFINPAIKLWDEIGQKNYLNIFLDFYNVAPILPAMSADELRTVMGIIKDLAPSLYEAIIEVDPTGADHFHRDDQYGSDNYTIFASKKDGLPEIAIGSETSNDPINIKRYNIAHELGHYALGHLSIEPEIAHKVLEKVAMEKRVLQIKKKPFEISGKLPFRKAFQHAFSRQKEFEADRFAVIELGVSIDDAIASEKAAAEKEQTEPETFKSTHPHLMARVKQLEDLRREVELRKGQKRQPTPINWKELAAQYLKEQQE